MKELIFILYLSVHVLWIEGTPNYYVEIHPLTSMIHTNGHTNFSCMYNATDPLIKWYINNTLVPSLTNLPNHHRIELHGNSLTLIITDVTLELNGTTYQCQLVKDRTIVDSEVATLYVLNISLMSSKPTMMNSGYKNNSNNTVTTEVGFLHNSTIKSLENDVPSQLTSSPNYTDFTKDMCAVPGTSKNEMICFKHTILYSSVASIFTALCLMISVPSFLLGLACGIRCNKMRTRVLACDLNRSQMGNRSESGGISQLYEEIKEDFKVIKTEKNEAYEQINL